MNQLGIPMLFTGAVLACAGSFAKDAPCDDGWLAIQAEVLRIDPREGDAKRLPALGRETKLLVNDVLCAGDTVIPGNTTVELYEAGRTRTVGANSRYTVQSNAGTAISKGAEYLKLALQSLASLEAPRARPNATSARGTQPVAPEASLPIRPIAPLKELPRQSLVKNLPVIVGWRDGIAPYSCESVSRDSRVLRSATEIETGWCEYSADLTDATRLLVRDARRRSIGWNLTSVDWRDVPRPEWIVGSANDSIAAADLSAWGIWLWENGGAQWRLQSLGMLNRVAKHEWLASYFVDHTLAEVPPVEARATGSQ